MRRSQSSDASVSIATQSRLFQPLVKSNSEAIIHPRIMKKIKPERLSPINSDDEDEEDEEVIEEQDEDGEENHEEENIKEIIAGTQSVVFNTTTAGLEKVVKRNSVININNIVNINNGNNNNLPLTTINNSKTRAESYPLSEVDMLKQELRNQKKSIEKIKKQNQLLTEENTAMKKLIETGTTPQPLTTSTTNSTTSKPSSFPLAASIAIVKVGYLIKRGLTWHNWCSRWCVLRWNTLTYFKSPSDTKPKGLFHLQGCQVAEHHDPKKPFTFTVQSRTRLWYFQATSQNELKSWMQAIETASQDRSSFTKLPAITENHSQRPIKSSKLFRFFGEEPQKDWSEEAIAVRHSTKRFDFIHPVPKEMMEFVSEKEARIIDESGLSLKQVQVNYTAFLSCAYFVSRDRYFKKRISEFNSAFPQTCNNNVTTPEPKQSGSQLHLNRAANRRSVNYSDATIGSLSPLSLSPLALSPLALYFSSLIVIYVGRLLSMHNPKDSYTFFEKIGKGGFASVYRAKHKGNKSIVAVKVLSQKFPEKRNAKMCHEVSILMTCNHPNIIKNVQNFLYNEEIYMVTEYCEIGTLDRIMKLELKEPAISFVLGQVLNGLVYLHNMGRVHRDIKSSNILINSLGHVKIGDLGLCEEVKNGPINGKMSGSKYWLAPEVINRQPYSTPVDIWNLGALGCAMVTKSPPNGSIHPVKAMYLVAAQGLSVTEILPKGSEWSEDFRDFLRLCFKLDPAQRPTAPALLQHPFLKIGKRTDIVPLINACLIAGYIV